MPKSTPRERIAPPAGHRQLLRPAFTPDRSPLSPTEDARGLAADLDGLIARIRTRPLAVRLLLAPALVRAVKSLAAIAGGRS